MDMRSNHQTKLHGILSTILAEHVYKRVNGRVAAERTISAYTEVLKMCFNTLPELGFHIQNPRNLNQEHIFALCQHWYDSGKKASTMQEYLSKVRVFNEEWLRKSDSVKSLSYYLPHVDPNLLIVRKVAVQSKSWSENGVDVMEKTEMADAEDWRFGLMVRMLLAFGVRRKEVINTKPWKADRGTHLEIFIGESKGGRPRIIPIDCREQREVLDYVKSKLGKNEHLGWYTTVRGKDATFKYSLRHYSYLMEKIGITKAQEQVTAHGLRNQYIENSALLANLIAPTLGGTGGQMAREDLNVIRAQQSENLGHSRIPITGAYYGSFGRETVPDSPDRRRLNIEHALQYCRPGVTKPVPEERIADCTNLVVEMEKIGVEMTPRQAQLLWEIHSQRHARYWTSLHKNNGAAIEAAALKLTRQMEKGKA